LEAALAALDMTQLLVDKLGAFDDEFSALKAELAESAIVIEGLRMEIETNRIKAERYDLMMQWTGLTDATLSE
jgi:hypothetical protein